MIEYDRSVADGWVQHDHFPTRDLLRSKPGPNVEDLGSADVVALGGRSRSPLAAPVLVPLACC
jgi:hypothetical protein